MRVFGYGFKFELGYSHCATRRTRGKNDNKRQEKRSGASDGVREAAAFQIAVVIFPYTSVKHVANYGKHS
jgi:nitrate reductase NapE component